MATSSLRLLSTFHGVLLTERVLFVGVGISVTMTAFDVCEVRSARDVGGNTHIVCPWSTPSYRSLV
jgi:hypothetical protein